MRAAYVTLPLFLVLLSQTSCSQKQEDPSPHAYQMGERVPVGHLIYTVFERQWLPQIGDGVDARVPQNRFYQIRISAVNSGGDAAILPPITLVDDNGAAYSEIENGEGVADFLGNLREVAPAETMQGNLVFDVQPKHYKLKFTDEEGKDIALVDIPLSFDADAPPELASPLNSDLTTRSDRTLRSDLTKK